MGVIKPEEKAKFDIDKSKLNSNFDDAKVEALIKGAREYGADLAGEHAASQVAISYETWQFLMGRRRTEEHFQDYVIAAAEHYNYIRFLAGLTGDPTTQLAPRAYDLRKKAYFALDLQDKLRSDPKWPVLPPNPKVLAWGNKGAADGLKDFKAANKDKPYQYGTAVAPLLKSSGVPDDVTKPIGDYAKSGNQKASKAPGPYKPTP